MKKRGAKEERIKLEFADWKQVVKHVLHRPKHTDKRDDDQAPSEGKRTGEDDRREDE